MENEKKLKMLQMFYAGALADSVLRLDREGVLEKVTEQKRQEQVISGKVKAEQLGIKSEKEVFEVLPEVFGCANWKVEENPKGFEATATNCILCAISKKMSSESPCNMCCLDPMEGLVKGLNENAEYKVESTLWNESKCKVTVRTGK